MGARKGEMSKKVVLLSGVVTLLIAVLVMTRQNNSASGRSKTKTSYLKWTPPPANHRFLASSCSIRRLSAVEAEKVGTKQLINASEPVIVPLDSYWQQAAQNWSLKSLFEKARSQNGGGVVKVGNRTNIVKKQGAADAKSISLLDYLMRMSAVQQNGVSENLVLFDQSSFCTHHHLLCQSHAIPKDWQSLIGTSSPDGQLAIRTFVSIGKPLRLSPKATHCHCCASVSQ